MAQQEQDSQFGFDDAEMVVCVDRVEGVYAVCVALKTEKILEILKDGLPKNVSEGDVLRWAADKKKWSVDFAMTAARRKENQKKLNSLLE
ncbi:MAG: DUF3006 domain-containing protein [Oscillospiraceae bacterium]|nr:DUF3006 domain-containing protein [Oscillospiraceae bacterium]